MRARNIKPNLFKNEILGTEDPFLTILFTGLWCLADKRGRLEDRPLRIKAEVFPYRDNLDVNGYLTVLERLGFIQRYVIDQVPYIQVLHFEKHQHPHHTEKESEIPPPPSIKSLKNNENSDLTVKQQEINGCAPSDSLIPDSLIPEKNPRAKNKTSSEEEFILPEDIPEVPWNEWMKSRKKKKAVDSPYAKNLLIKNLREISTKTKISITDLIHEAIARDWKGIKEEWVVKTHGGSYVASNGQNGSRPKTFKEIDEERDRENRRNYLKWSGLLPDEPSLDAGLSGILDLGEENA